jgi:hypothetical protein
MQKLVPLELQHIEEGRFLDDVQTELADIQRTLIAFKDKHGENADKAKASMTIKIEASYLADGDMYIVTGELKKSLPGRPKSSNVALASETTDDQPALFVRVSGADAADPRQSKLCTDDGREVPQN